MQEDVLGTRQSVVGERYDRCTRCGLPTPREHVAVAHVVGEGPPSPVGPRAARPLETTQDAPPPLLCADCAHQVALGEPIEPTDEPAHEPPAAATPR